MLCNGLLVAALLGSHGHTGNHGALIFEFVSVLCANQCQLSVGQVRLGEGECLFSLSGGRKGRQCQVIQTGLYAGQNGIKCHIVDDACHAHLICDGLHHGRLQTNDVACLVLECVRSEGCLSCEMDLAALLDLCDGMILDIGRAVGLAVGSLCGIAGFLCCCICGCVVGRCVFFAAAGNTSDCQCCDKHSCC